ncbi:hypothetical protein [Escherichia coli]|uniref:hypothetical protein n=1 Tax=Escherichia coli TaxID=562 RepID=UPI0020294A61|nr:hypothetical protein [Escherichia coli]
MVSAVQDSETVVELFCFFALPFMPFLSITALMNAIRESLPPGKKTGQVSCRIYGETGRRTDPGVEDKVEPLLFDAVQKTWRLKSATDIPGIFIRVGICTSACQ